MQHPIPKFPLVNIQRWQPIPDSLDSTKREESSLDFTQRIERKLAKHNASRNIFKRWLFDIMSCVVSASCMVAIVLIYAHIKDQPMSKGGILLNWNNVLGKVASAALIVPRYEALGQLKWHWFHNSKAMWDFEIFDKASRGPMGALMLLYRTKGRSLAALGTLLIVLMLGIDTEITSKIPLYGDGSLHFKGIRHKIQDVFIVSASDCTAETVYWNETPVAQACHLSWCVKTMQSSYTWGGYVEEVISTTLNTTGGPFPWQAFPYRDRKWYGHILHGKYHYHGRGNNRRTQDFRIWGFQRDCLDNYLSIHRHISFVHNRRQQISSFGSPLQNMET